MIEPIALRPNLSIILSVFGGLVGTILLSGLLYAAPIFGFSAVDLPRGLGGLFTASDSAALGLGFVLLFLIGVVVFPSLLAATWPALPGAPVGFKGAALKGVLAVPVVWAAFALLLLVSGQAHAGALVSLLAASLGYALALALIAAMGQGITPLDTFGWPGHAHGDTRDVALTWVSPLKK